MSMEDTDLHERLMTVVAQAEEEGCPVVSPHLSSQQRIVETALRRWRTYTRRQKRRRTPPAERVEDLAKGLRDASERDPRLVGPLMEDYRYLARQLAVVFALIEA